MVLLGADSHARRPVFRRTSASTGDALRIVALWVRLQDCFNFDFVAPIIAEVVNVEKLVAHLQTKELEF